MKALILAGGLGTRLRGVLPNIPKPMAPIDGRPFIEYLIGQLKNLGVQEIILSTGHLAEMISDHFGDGRHLDVAISYSREERPLGTGGAIRHARRLLGAESFIVMNGDSFVDADFSHVIAKHHDSNGLATIALTEVDDTSRYGVVEVDHDDRILGFVEKGESSSSRCINSGVYVLSPKIFDEYPQNQEKVSLEQEVFPAIIGKSFWGITVEGFFKDIGIPEDYQALCEDPAPLHRAAGL